MVHEITNFKSLIDLIKVFSSEQICVEHLETLRWNGNVVSPFDASSKVYKCKGFKYRCKNTGKYFNVRTGTIFDNSKVPLQKWFMAIYIMSSHKKGVSSHQIARDLNITQKTGWFMLHRIRYAFSHENYKKTLENTVETDETFFGGKEGNKHKNKKREPTGKKGGGRGDDKTTVIGLIERGGNVIAKCVPDARAKHIMPFINKNVKKGSRIISDEYRPYVNLRYRFNHQTIKHSLKLYVEGDVHTNSIENFWSVLKRGIYGIYHNVSEKHMQQYLNEFTYRFNSRKTKDIQRFNTYFVNVDKRLTYKNLIADDKKN